MPEKALTLCLAQKGEGRRGEGERGGEGEGKRAISSSLAEQLGAHRH